MALTFYVFPYAGKPFLQTSRALILSSYDTESPCQPLDYPWQKATVPAPTGAHLQIMSTTLALSGQAKCETWVSSALQQKGMTHRQRRAHFPC